MNSQHEEQTIREAIGIFFEADKLEEAIVDLKASGFHKEQLGLLAGEFTVRDKLGHLYTEVNTNKDDSQSPNTSFVAKESVDDTVHGLLGTLYMVGTALAGGAVVASAGILGGAVAVATATTAVFGGMGAVLVSIIHKSDAEYLEEQVNEGHLVLFVRTRDKKEENSAVEILARHSAFDPRIHTVPAASVPV